MVIPDTVVYSLAQRDSEGLAAYLGIEQSTLVIISNRNVSDNDPEIVRIRASLNENNISVVEKTSNDSIWNVPLGKSNATDLVKYILAAVTPDEMRLILLGSIYQ